MIGTSTGPGRVADPGTPSGAEGSSETPGPSEIEVRIGRLLAEPGATDLCFSAAGFRLDQGEGLRPVPVGAPAETEVRDWVLRRISAAGRAFDAKTPYLDLVASPPGSGLRYRLHAIFPPISERVLVSLRKLPGPGAGSPVWAGSPGYAALRAIVRAGETLLIAGSTGSGKTRLLNELLAELDPHERILALEDTAELAPAHPHFHSLLARPANADGYGEVTLRALLRQTLRMRPDRIVLGEVRGPEVLDLLQALNTGHRGTLATLHANSPRDALRRIETLCLLAAGTALPLGALRELLATGVKWIAQVERTADGRRITSLAEVAGREGDTILLRNRFGEDLAGAGPSPISHGAPPISPLPRIPPRFG